MVVQTLFDLGVEVPFVGTLRPMWIIDKT